MNQGKLYYSSGASWVKKDTVKEHVVFEILQRIIENDLFGAKIENFGVLDMEQN